MQRYFMNQVDITVNIANSVSIKIISNYDAFVLFLGDKYFLFLIMVNFTE